METRVRAAALLCAAVLPSAVGFINIPGGAMQHASLRAGATCAVPRPPPHAHAQARGAGKAASMTLGQRRHARCPPVRRSRRAAVFGLPLCMRGGWRHAARVRGVTFASRAAAHGSRGPFRRNPPYGCGWIVIVRACAGWCREAGAAEVAGLAARCGDHRAHRLALRPLCGREYTFAHACRHAIIVGLGRVDTQRCSMLLRVRSVREQKCARACAVGLQADMNEQKNNDNGPLPLTLENVEKVSARVSGVAVYMRVLRLSVPPAHMCAYARAHTRTHTHTHAHTHTQVLDTMRPYLMSDGGNVRVLSHYAYNTADRTAEHMRMLPFVH